LLPARIGPDDYAGTQHFDQRFIGKHLGRDDQTADQLAPAVHAHLVEDRLEVILHCVRADAELAGNRGDLRGV
jgi:hypothetical protein